MINPIVITVDPALYANGRSQIYVDGDLVIDKEGETTISLLGRVERLVKRDCIIVRVDGVGIGQGVVDALRQNGYQVVIVEHP